MSGGMNDAAAAARHSQNRPFASESMNRVIRASLVLFAAAGTAACGAHAQTRASQPSPAGTYRVQICRAPCDPRIAADIATGTLVLMPSAFTPTRIAGPALAYFQRYERGLLVVYAENQPNSCFVLQKGSSAGSYAGNSPVALTRWSARGNGDIGFPLFQTPDAGYSTTVRIAGRDLVGGGSSWGPDSSMDSMPADSVFAQRIGPPDLSVCERAATAEARRRESTGGSKDGRGTEKSPHHSSASRVTNGGDRPGARSPRHAQ